MDLTELKKIARAAIDDECDAVIGLSRYINDNPEIAYEEKKAAAEITDFLLQRNFSIKMKKPAGIPGMLLLNLQATLQMRPFSEPRKSWLKQQLISFMAS